MEPCKKLTVSKPKILGEFQNLGWVPNEVKKSLDQAKSTAYRLKISLVGLEPPVWRQVLCQAM